MATELLGQPQTKKPRANGAFLFAGCIWSGVEEAFEFGFDVLDLDEYLRIDIVTLSGSPLPEEVQAASVVGNQLLPVRVEGRGWGGRCFGLAGGVDRFGLGLFGFSVGGRPFLSLVCRRRGWGGFGPRQRPGDDRFTRFVGVWPAALDDAAGAGQPVEPGGGLIPIPANLPALQLAVAGHLLEEMTGIYFAEAALLAGHLEPPGHPLEQVLTGLDQGVLVVGREFALLLFEKLGRYGLPELALRIRSQGLGRSVSVGEAPALPLQESQELQRQLGLRLVIPLHRSFSILWSDRLVETDLVTWPIRLL